MSDFPTCADELTLSWLQNQLSQTFPNSMLEGFSLETIGVGQGFMGQLVRIQLEFQEHRPGLPDTIIAKFASAKIETRELAAKMNYYGREIGFYQDFHSQAGIPIPKSFAINYDAANSHFVLLLEDLAPATITDQVEGNSEAESEQVIIAFARFHSHWWNNPALLKTSWAESITNARPISDTLELFMDSMRQAEQTQRFAAYPEMQRLIPLLIPLFRMEPPQPFPFTLVHGDLRSDNIFFPRNSRGHFKVIDWQTTGIGQPMTDIARWLTQSISIEQRRKTEHTLLQLYHRQLVANGINNYSYKSMLNEYKLNLVVTLLMFSMSMDDIDQSSDRAAPLFHVMYSRLDAALVDWEVEKILKILPYLLPFMKLSTWIKTKLARSQTP